MNQSSVEYPQILWLEVSKYLLNPRSCSYSISVSLFSCCYSNFCIMFSISAYLITTCKQELSYILTRFIKSYCIYSSSILALESFCSKFSFKNIILFFITLFYSFTIIRNISLLVSKLIVIVSIGEDRICFKNGV
jgi:hypothetical protein